MTATVITEIQREVCGLQREIMKSLPFGAETFGQVGRHYLRSISRSPPVQFQLTSPLGVNIPNVLFIPEIELGLAASQGCILRRATPAQRFQALLCSDNVLASHEDVQILGLAQAHISVHFERQKGALQWHHAHACVIQGFQNAGKQLKVDDGLHSAGIAPFSQLAHDLFWYGESAHPFEGGPTESRSPMAI
jgi:hypothetical protein